ncbi:MAG: aspartyl protease family protein [Phycisphaerales bacterium]|nr:aspartyl protease family protein [Phycisphaerales bacterium]
MLMGAALLLGGCALGFNPQRVPASVEIPAEGVIVPLEVADNLPFVQVSVNGSEPLWFMIDTGAFTAIIDDDAAAAAGMKASMRFGTHATSAGDHFGRMDQAAFDRLTIGGATFAGFEGLVADLSHLEAAVDHPFDGVIGIPLMYASVWTIDYPGRQLRIAPASAELPDDEHVLPFLYSGDAPAIEIHVGEVAIQAEIDTGSSSGLDLSPEDAQRFPRDDGPSISIRHQTLTGEVWEELVRLKGTVRIGSLTREGLMVSLARDTMLGGEILSNCIFTIDCPRQRVRIEELAKESAAKPAEEAESNEAAADP